ncbi:MAG: peptidoglycan-binding protein [Christensenellales bacterium]|jgi:peptidoglycan hydrolase-like protein with peptidoglycan-binding domain
MASINASDLVSFVFNAKNDGWGYVYSAQGQLYSRRLAEQWGNANRAGKGYDYFVKKCSRWFGKIVVDCSGLVIEAYRSQIPSYSDKTANALFGKSAKKGVLNTIPEIPGLCVWRNGHIGIYIGYGQVIEAGGTNVGVVLSALSAPATNKPWTNWSMLADVDYSVTAEPPATEPPACWLGRNLKLTDPYMHGNDVSQIQKALAAIGFSPSEIDGIFGPITQKAVISFQKQAKLIVDGIVGKNTTNSLLGIWVTDYNGNPYCPWKEMQLSSFKLKRLLKINSPYLRGDDISDVQDALRMFGFSPGNLDGIYGNKTMNAVIEFQKKNRLRVDGIVGKETSTALGGIWMGN